MGWPDAGKSEPRQGEMLNASQQGQGDKGPRTDPAMHNCDRQGKATDLNQQGDQQLRIMRDRHHAQPVIQYYFAGGVSIEKSRSGVVKVETRIIAVNFSAMPGI